MAVLSATAGSRAAGDMWHMALRGLQEAAAAGAATPPLLGVGPLSRSEPSLGEKE
jgi:hypothetical protein